MTPNLSDKSCSSDINPVSCRVEAVLSMDNRGQIVLPKEVRKKANIRDGDKLALVSWIKEDVICCLALIRTDTISSEVSGVMRSLLADNV
jgi:AbrB family looped-hinge helix DNA binding protein